MLADARAEAKKHHIQIGKLTVWRECREHNCYMEVYEEGHLIWCGSAYDANEAKSNAIARKFGHLPTVNINE